MSLQGFITTIFSGCTDRFYYRGLNHLNMACNGTMRASYDYAHLHNERTMSLKEHVVFVLCMRKKPPNQLTPSPTGADSQKQRTSIVSATGNDCSTSKPRLGCRLRWRGRTPGSGIAETDPGRRTWRQFQWTSYQTRDTEKKPNTCGSRC